MSRRQSPAELAQLGETLVDEILPEAIDYFTGRAEERQDAEYNSEDESDEESGDEDEEIDLEDEPVKKKRKMQG